MDKSILMQPVRLHITLGVMTLNEDSNPVNETVEGPGATETQPEQPPRTVSDALALLYSLKDAIVEELGSESKDLIIPLNKMDVLKTEAGQMAHVLWAGPKPSREKSPLDRVSNLVNKAFRENGFITEKRPLKLHCTIINTKYRKGGKGRPIPFSKEEIFSSPAYQNLQPNSSANANEPGSSSSVHGDVDFGSWTVGDIHLCAMSGRDPITGGYRSVGSLKFS